MREVRQILVRENDLGLDVLDEGAETGAEDDADRRPAGPLRADVLGGIFDLIEHFAHGLARQHRDVPILPVMRPRDSRPELLCGGPNCRYTLTTGRAETPAWRGPEIDDNWLPANADVFDARRR